MSAVMAAAAVADSGIAAYAAAKAQSSSTDIAVCIGTEVCAVITGTPAFLLQSVPGAAGGGRRSTASAQPAVSVGEGGCTAQQGGYKEQHKENSKFF